MFCHVEMCDIELGSKIVVTVGFRCCGDTVEKNQQLWVPTPEYTTGSLRMTCWVSKALIKPLSINVMTFTLK